MRQFVWYDIIIYVQDVTHAPHIIIEGIAFTINQLVFLHTGCLMTPRAFFQSKSRSCWKNPAISKGSWRRKRWGKRDLSNDVYVIVEYYKIQIMIICSVL